MPSTISARGRLQMVCPVLPFLQIISERHPSTSLRHEKESKEPFVIPTLNIFLKTRFRPDFADTDQPRARTEMKLRKEELFALC